MSRSSGRWDVRRGTEPGWMGAGWTRGVDARLDPDGLGLPLLCSADVNRLVSSVFSCPSSPLPKKIFEKLNGRKMRQSKFITKPSTFH